jgi:hypothetical protein
MDHFGLASGPPPAQAFPMTPRRQQNKTLAPLLLNPASPGPPYSHHSMALNLKIVHINDNHARWASGAQSPQPPSW